MFLVFPHQAQVESVICNHGYIFYVVSAKRFSAEGK